ncbi:MAG TPA: class I SAM-dependent methyltransferase [Vicinamibacteria bacterium]|nr:class I SAM-dependent methyltransferase [Vicinamibacteria bacterium]
MAEARPLPAAKFTALDAALYSYLREHRTPDDEVMQDLQAETARLGSHAVMQISPDQGSLLRLLVAAIGARRAVEVGTFTGMSALCIARGLAEGGRLLCCDVSDEWTAIGRRHWERAGVADRIELRLGPAEETLRALPEAPAFDFGFIDADKVRYLTYYEEILKRLRPGGLIGVDNVLWSGDVIRKRKRDRDTRAIRAFNDFVASDARVESVMLPVADGLTLVRKL